MPGLDQRGPEGRGTMTGRRKGICQSQGFADIKTACGFGSSRGKGNCHRNGAGRRFGRRPSVGRAEMYQTEASLQDRARILEDELNAVKDQLKAMSNKEY